jgi:cardiolipin synthase
MKKYLKADSVQLILSGNDFFETLGKLIDSAQHTIQIQTYIFEDDLTGKEVISKLTAAVKRGVQVYVLADAYGSKSLSRKFLKEVEQNGIHFRLFSPFFSTESIYMGRRLHHKIVVIDKKEALVGGINIADKYHGNTETPAWLDYAVLLNGDECRILDTICTQLYAKKRYRKRWLRKSEPDSFTGTIPVRFTINDWVTGRNEIHNSYLQAVYSAKKSVIFIASYFLPGYKFRNALKDARKRGIEVSVILAGKSDMPFLWYAEKYLYLFFIRNGIKIYEWQDSIMHAKALIADDDWTTVGSYNLNPVSHYWSIELNVEIKDRQFTQALLEQTSELIRNHCREVTMENESRFGFLSRIKSSILYYFFRFVFTLLISKKKIRKS